MPSRRNFLYGAGAAATSLIFGTREQDEVLASSLMKDNRNPWWRQGANKAVTSEREILELKTEGTIPKAINGLYLRNGPNQKKGLAKHYFEGNGMLHGVGFQDGRALFYKNRWVKTSLLGTTKIRGIRNKDNLSNTNIIKHGERILSLHESGFPYEIGKNLETIGPYNAHGMLTSAMTAHPKIHLDTGDLHYYGMNFFKNPYLQYGVIGENGHLKKKVNIHLRASSMQHDFQITKNHVIFMDLPIIFKLSNVLFGKFPYEWQGDLYPAKMAILKSDGEEKDIKWFPVETCSIFHTINAYESLDNSNEITLDAVRFHSQWKNGPYDLSEKSHIYRYVFNLETGHVHEAMVDDLYGAFPNINPLYQGKPYRYSYLMSFVKNELLDAPDRLAGLVKLDLKTGAKQTYQYPPHLIPSEHNFVPDGKEGAEDKGYLMGFVYNTETENSELDIFSAENIAQGPIARVHITGRVPLGFHGNFLEMDL